MPRESKNTLHLFAKVSPPFLTKRLLCAFSLAALFHLLLFSVFIIDLGHFLIGKGEPSIVVFAESTGTVLSLEKSSKKGPKVPKALIIPRKSSPDLSFSSFQELHLSDLPEKETVDFFVLNERSRENEISPARFSLSRGVKLKSAPPKIQGSRALYAKLDFVASKKTNQIISLTWAASTGDKHLDQTIERAAKTLVLSSLEKTPYYAGTLEVDFIP